MVKTNLSAPFYIPLFITITKFPDFIFNSPPFFKEPAEVMIHIMVASATDNNVYRLNITEQFDDYNRIDYLNISSG